MADELIFRREGQLPLGRPEREVAEQFDAGLFVSSAEATMFCQLAPESAHKVGYYNNGVNSDYFAPDPGFPNPYSPDAEVLVFTGAMDYWPNIDAVSWFARQVFPRLRAARAGLEFYVVGSSPATEVKQLAQLPGVTVTGRVEDEALPATRAGRRGTDAHCPRCSEQGVEAMAMAKPVIVSAKGLEGIDAVHGQHVLLADTAGDYLDALQQVLNGAHRGLGQSARDHISGCFNWDANLPEVVYLLAGRPPAAPLEKASA
ncbi:MAG: glycosyltransferase [Halioglobus sp.]